MPLRWVEEGEEEFDLQERREICELNVESVSLKELSSQECWTIGTLFVYYCLHAQGLCRSGRR